MRVSPSGVAQNIAILLIFRPCNTSRQNLKDFDEF
ncbi:hypothetical protein EAMG_03510 [Escherichia coli M056]|nr:hypothetical protein EAMG_03510 [Escherichia coli M056]